MSLRHLDVVRGPLVAPHPARGLEVVDEDIVLSDHEMGGGGGVGQASYKLCQGFES